MTKNDKVSSWVKMTKKWQIMTHKGPKICFILMRYLDMNYSIFKMLKNAKKSKVWSTDQPTDWPTDTASFRVACTLLKRNITMMLHMYQVFSSKLGHLNFLCALFLYFYRKLFIVFLISGVQKNLYFSIFSIIKTT